MKLTGATMSDLENLNTRLQERIAFVDLMTRVRNELGPNLTHALKNGFSIIPYQPGAERFQPPLDHCSVRMTMGDNKEYLLSVYAYPAREDGDTE